MSKLLKLSAAALVVAPVMLFASSAKADSPGQLTGGDNVYTVKNVTKNGAYASSASVACGEKVRYSVRLHNAAYGGLTHVIVKANLADGTVSATPAEGADAGTSGKVTVSVSGGTLAYKNGSTVLYDANGKALNSAFADTITTTGVDVGSINGSTTEFVNFEAEVNCPTPTPTPTPSPAATTKAPTALPNTGAGEVVGVFAGASAAGAAAHAVVSRRSRREQ